MKTLFRLSAFIGVIAFTACVTSAPITPHVSDPSYRDELFTAVFGHIAKSIPKGAFVATVVDLDSDTVWFGSHGFEDSKGKTPASENTLLRIASVTKTFTALAALNLSEEGLLPVDEPITRAIPEFSIRDPRWPGTDAPTPRLIMTHRSGLPADILKDFSADVPNATIVERFAESFRAFPPGYVHSYSNASISLLGYAITRATAIDYADYVATRIIEPAGMEKTVFITDPADAPSLAEGVSQDGKWSKGEIISRDMAGGALASTSRDMSRYIRYILTGTMSYTGERLLESATIDDMWTVSEDDTSRDVGAKVGMGWFAEDTPFGRVWKHGGDAFNYLSSLMIVPELGIGVFVSTSYGGGSNAVDDAARELLRLSAEAKTGNMYDKSTDFTSFTKVPATEEELDAMAGYWQMPGMGLLKIERAGEELILHITGNPPVFLIKCSDGRWRFEARAWIIPLNIPELKLYSIIPYPDSEAGEKILKFSLGLLGGFPITKIAPCESPEAWRIAVGKYATNEGYEVSISERDGFLIFEFDNGAGAKPFAIEPFTDGKGAVLASLMGVGRGLGEVVELLPDGSIKFSGLVGIKK